MMMSSWNVVTLHFLLCHTGMWLHTFLTRGGPSLHAAGAQRGRPGAVNPGSVFSSRLTDTRRVQGTPGDHEVGWGGGGCVQVEDQREEWWKGGGRRVGGGTGARSWPPRRPLHGRWVGSPPKFTAPRLEVSGVN